MDGLIDIMIYEKLGFEEWNRRFQIVRWDSQSIAEIVAALHIGNNRLKSSSVQTLIQSLEKLLARDPEHYLMLRESDDLSDFYDCGTAQEGADTMAMIGRPYRLYSIPKAECPNCKPDEEDSDDDE